jgi:methylated-DNA-[protein]-cysteine S-methyltransferase
MEMYYQELKTPIGTLLVAASSRGICRIGFPSESAGHRADWFHRHFSVVPQRGVEGSLTRVMAQLNNYFEGQEEAFDVPLDLRGTPFQVRVWRQLLDIPYGATVSYGEVARAIGNPRASQAVGAAVGKNPVPIVVPCHRVIGHDGSLVGFGGGLPTKEKLLKLEGVLKPLTI